MPIHFTSLLASLALLTGVCTGTGIHSLEGKLGAFEMYWWEWAAPFYTADCYDGVCSTLSRQGSWESSPFCKQAQCYPARWHCASLCFSLQLLWANTECCRPDTRDSPPAHPARSRQKHAKGGAGHLPPRTSSATAASSHEESVERKRTKTPISKVSLCGGWLNTLLQIRPLNVQSLHAWGVPVKTHKITASQRGVSLTHCYT